MAVLPQISEAEFEVMKIVWKYAPINTNEDVYKRQPHILHPLSWQPPRRPTSAPPLRAVHPWDSAYCAVFSYSGSPTSSKPP